MLIYSWDTFEKSILLKNKYKSSYTKISVKTYLLSLHLNLHLLNRGR